MWKSRSHINSRPSNAIRKSRKNLIHMRIIQHTNERIAARILNNCMCLLISMLSSAHTHFRKRFHRLVKFLVCIPCRSFWIFHNIWHNTWFSVQASSCIDRHTLICERCSYVSQNIGPWDQLNARVLTRYRLFYTSSEPFASIRTPVSSYCVSITDARSICFSARFSVLPHWSSCSRNSFSRVCVYVHVCSKVVHLIDLMRH